MGEHLINGEFQSDKYPTTPRGFVPLKVSDPMAQDLLAIYAQRGREVDEEFADDLLEALRLKGYPELGQELKCLRCGQALSDCVTGNLCSGGSEAGSTTLPVVGPDGC